MIWIVIIIVGIVLFNLGALSVLVSVLSVAFKVAVVLIACMGLFMIWVQHRKQ